MEFGDHFLQRYFTKQKSLKKKIVISPIGSLEPWAIKQKWLKKKKNCMVLVSKKNT